MRLPWVSRAALEAVERERDLCKRWLATEQQRAEMLLTQVLTLKVQGAQAPLAKRESDGVMQAIADVAGSNAPLRGHLGQYARTEKALGTDTETIIETIRHWPSDEDGVED